jgi:hypothetical protein
MHKTITADVIDKGISNEITVEKKEVSNKPLMQIIEK